MLIRPRRSFVTTWVFISIACGRQETAGGPLDELARQLIGLGTRCQRVEYAPTPGVSPFRDCRVDVGDTTGVVVSDATGAIVFVGKKWSSGEAAARAAFDRLSDELSESYGRPDTTKSGDDSGRQFIRRWHGSGFTVDLIHSADGELRMEWTLKM